MIFNTLFLAGTTCAISLPPGVLLGWLLARTDLPGRRAALLLLGVLLFMPLYLQAAAWQAGFGVQGWCTMASAAPLRMEGWTGVIWIHAMAALPWVVLICGAGFRLIEPELEEQALLDGSTAQTFVRVTLRSAAPAVAVAGLWVGITAAGEMTVSDLFGVRTYAEELYTHLAIGRQPGEASLAVLPGAILAAFLVLGGLALCARLVPPDRPISFRRPHVFRLGRWRWPVAVLVAIVLLLLAGVPLGNLCYKAGVVVTQTDLGRLRSWSPVKCLLLVIASPLRYRRELDLSLAISSLAATGAVLVATGLAWCARAGRRRALSALAAAAFCLALPGPLVGLGIIHLLNHPGVPPLVYLYDRSILAPCLALMIRGLPPATLIMWHALRTIPLEVLDVASVDGAGPIARLWRIALPCRLPALVLSWVIALAVALGDLAASILVVPPGVTTLSIRIFGLLHYGVEDQVAGICLALVAIFAVFAASATRLAPLVYNGRERINTIRQAGSAS